jgi:hypothetical protein
MPPFPDAATVQRKLSSLPVAAYGAGETVVTEGTRTGRLLFLKTGAVSIVKGDTRDSPGDRARRYAWRTFCTA